MEDFTKVMVLENTIEANLVHSILNERDIPHIMRSYYDTAYDGLYQTQKGWGHINAPLSYHDEIKEVVFDLRSKPITN
jgi:hypothetical protein